MFFFPLLVSIMACLNVRFKPHWYRTGITANVFDVNNWTLCLDKVEWCDCCSLHTVTFFCDLLQYTHTENVIYLYYTIKKFKVYWRIFGHEKRKTSPLAWYGMDLTSSVCVSFNRSWLTTNENTHRSHVIV